MSDEKKAYKEWFHSTHPIYENRELAAWLAACEWKDKSKFFDESIALKQALLNCRMERDEPETVKFLVDEALTLYPLKLEDLDKI